MKDISLTKKIAIRAVLIAIALVLSYVESQFSLFLFVPGMKIGLTNIVVLVALYTLSIRDAIIINLIRIIIVGFTFGNMFSLMYSLAGGLLSLMVMIILKQIAHASIVTVSIAGGISHNIGQIIVAMIVMETNSIAYYLVVLWISGIVAGIIVGALSTAIINRLPNLEKVR